MKTREHPATATCSVVAVLTTHPRHAVEELRVLRRVGGSLEVRADLVADADPSALREHVAGELVYCLRSRREGGVFAGGVNERHRRLVAAARRYDLVDLEAERDLTPGVLAAVPPRQRRISWHGKGMSYAALLDRVHRMTSTPARQYLVVPEASSAREALAPLRLLKALGRNDVTAYSTGETGSCGRLLAPWLGAPTVSGRIGDGVGDIPTIGELTTAYPFPRLPPLERLFGILGPSVHNSLSPRLHNSRYRATGLPALFLPVATSRFADTWRTLPDGLGDLGFPFGGATIIAPYKEAALRLADEASADANRSRAANLLVRCAGGWRAHTTDPAGVVGALRQAGVVPDGLKAAVVGCGGAGRGAAVGLALAGATPTLVNRGAGRGNRAARALGLDYLPLDRFVPGDYPLVVHATPVSEQPLFPVDGLADDAVVVDLNYRARPTALVAAARRRRLRVVDGWAVLRAEIAAQFHLMTSGDDR